VSRFAFVVGADGPETPGRLKRLKFAASDARRFADRIKRKDLNFLVFPRGRGKFGGDVTTQLNNVASGLVPGDELLFYFSGHGVARHGDLFLILNGTRLERLDSTALAWSRIEEIIGQSPARSKVVILDCCHARETVDEAFDVSYRGGLDDKALEAMRRGSTASTLLACGPDGAARESAAIGGGFLTTLILQALGPKRRQAADGTGRLSMESMQDWMHGEIDHSESLAAIRLEKPLLFSPGGPSFYLDHQPHKSAPDAMQRTVLSDMAASPQSGEPLIRFLDPLWPDPASVTQAKSAFQNGATGVAVEWPRSTIAISSAFDTIINALQDEKNRPMELQAKPREEISHLLEGYVGLRDRSRAIMETVPRRLFVTWTNTHRNRHAIDETLRNFLALANLRVFHDLLVQITTDLPSFARAHVPKELTCWSATADSPDSHWRASFAKLFGVSEPVYDAEILEIDGIPIKGNFRAFGPKQMVLEAAERSSAGNPIVNGWFFKYLVPQVELYLATSAEPLSISYSETAVLRTLRDGNGNRVR